MTSQVLSTIDLVGVGKCYAEGTADAWALRDVTLRVGEGEVVALVGPSGSGKSTLLNLVAGLDVPTAGTVHLAGQSLAELSDDARSDLRLRSVGFVFQAFNLLPHLTAEENVAWPHRMVGASWRDARARAAASLHEVGLPAAAHARVPSALSGGEQQRVAIARALVNEPRVLLADEPTGNLDARTAGAVLDVLEQASTTRGLTLVIVTHNATLARRAGRIVALDDGRLVDVRSATDPDARRPAGARA